MGEWDPERRRQKGGEGLGSWPGQWQPAMVSCPPPPRCNSRQCETADGPPVPSDCSCVAGGENKVWAVGVARKSWGSTHPRVHLRRGFRAVTASGRMLRAEGWERPPCD